MSVGSVRVKINPRFSYPLLALLLALTGLFIFSTAQVSADPGITFDKTVGLDIGECATETNVMLPYGGGYVYYCYSITNTGTVTFTFHTVEDNRLGTLLSSFPITVAPAENTWFTHTAFITQPTMNVATWTAFNAVPSETVTATAFATVEIMHPQLALDKAVSPAFAEPGDAVTYTLAFANVGTYTATGVLLTDIFPAEIADVVIASSGVVITDVGAPLYTWSVADLPPGTGGVITLTGIFSVPVASPPGTQVSNSATITCTEDPEGDEDMVVLAVPFRDLEIHKYAYPDPAIAGRSIVYTVTVTNRGSDSMANVVITDTLPPSTTLHTVDQTDDGWGGFDLGEHWHTYWETGRPNIPADNWLRLSTPITHTGVFTSRIFDAFNVVNWTSLYWTPRRPYAKALPDDGQAETAYELGNANMLGNQVLLHLDTFSDTTVITDSAIIPVGTGVTSDTSGLDTPAVCPAVPVLGVETCPGLIQDGRFMYAFNFAGAFSQTLRLDDPHDPLRYAVELWVRPSVVANTSFILRTDALTEAVEPGHYSHLLGIQDGKFIHYVNAGSGRSVIGTTDVQAGTWYHLVGTAQSNGDLELFVNGHLEGRRGGLGMLWTGGDHYRLGAAYGPTGTTTYFSGDLDEVAIYSRTLSSSEVVDHYLRGALRLGIQVRSCADSECADGDFVGPGGLPAASFTEQDATLMGGDMPLMASLDLPDNRYAQYQVTLETDDLTYTPELYQVSLGPAHRAVTATQGSCVGTDQTFTCTLGSLAPGETITVSAGAWINSWALGWITNTAGVTSTTGGEITVTNNITELGTIIDGEVDLIVEKYDDEWNGGTDPVNPGSVMTYTLLVRNAGPSAARFVTVTDTFSGTFIAAIPPDRWDPCQVTAHTLTCTVAALGATGYNWEETYDWEEIVVTAYAPLSVGVITNTVWVTSTTYETPLDVTDNMTIETTLVTPLADVSVRKTASTDLVDPGAPLTYVISVMNAGPYTATNVVVTDTLPSDALDPVLDDGGLWSCSWPEPDVVACALLSDLSVGASASLTITVTAPPSGFLDNHAHVTADQYDLDTDNNWDSAYTVVRPVADLSINKLDTPDPVYAGATLTYTVIVTNAGPAAAGAMTTSVRVGNGNDIRIPIRAGTAQPPQTSVWVTNMPGVIQNLTVTLRGLSHSFPADLGILLVGPTGQNVLLMGNAGGGTDADDLDLVFHDGGVAVTEPLDDALIYQPTNNGLTDEFVSVPGPYGGSLSAFYGDSPNGRWRLYVLDTVYSDGGLIEDGWQLEVTTVTTDTITLTDTVHSGLVVQPPLVAPADWTCNGVGSQNLECETPFMDVDETAVFNFTVTAPITGGVITNSAGITSTTDDIVPENNVVVITTTVSPYADLGIAKRVTPEVVGVGDPLTYTLEISNAGPSPLISTPVVVSDQLPPQLTGVTVIPNGWICDVTALPVFTCTLDGLAVGPAPLILVTASAPTATMRITNTASVSTVLFDPDLANNTAEVGLIIDSYILDITKSVMPQENVSYHRPVTYTVVVANTGLLDARDVHVNDPLPLNTIFARWVEQPVGATITPGTPQTLNWTGVVSGLNEVRFTFVVTHTGDYLDVISNTATYTTALVSGSDTVTFTVGGEPGIALTKTVGTDPSVCATGDLVELPHGGGMVVYCYTIENTGAVALSLHNLVDSHLGTLRTGWAYTLEPGTSTFFTVSANITQTTTNVATWTAYNAGGWDQVEDSDGATVDVAQIYTLQLPMVMRNYVTAPDLVVTDLVVTGNAVTVTIRNQGDLAVADDVTNEFWLDVYIGPDTPPTQSGQLWRYLGLQGVAWGITSDAFPIMPGDELVLTMSSPYYRPDFSAITGTIPAGTQVWAQVDSANKVVNGVPVTYGAVLENHEINHTPYNNIYGPVSSTGAVSLVRSRDFEPERTLLPLSEYLPPRRNSQ
ncbi:MAG: DUF11 domain-containing protein [Anaerolineae bacterium]|nr:DUF11 domain-containing protein [Anaerolineae bacterium]